MKKVVHCYVHVLYPPMAGDAGALQMTTTRTARRAMANAMSVCLRTCCHTKRSRRLTSWPFAEELTAVALAVEAEGEAVGVNVNVGGFAFGTARGKRPLVEPLEKDIPAPALAPKAYVAVAAAAAWCWCGTGGDILEGPLAPPAKEPDVTSTGVLIRDGSICGGITRGEASRSVGPRFLATVEACVGGWAAAIRKRIRCKTRLDYTSQSNVRNEQIEIKCSCFLY